ncbi:MAG: glutamine--fructose-6-phosphate transaminase (isomerizing) [Gammaproteobacteria bacterium]|nr:glutamine--fructose-6-phosphate transaminase (isomerizing) [Gammaproteobacteria bacterium]
MCGIVGAVAERSVAPILIQVLQRLEYRGYDSAGVAIVQSDGKVQRRREVGKVVNLSDNLDADPVKGSIGIAHTRWATHGAVQQTNTHPHMSGNDLALVHNGIIENYMTLREELQSKGYVFASETDSETIVHLIHSCLGDDGLLQAVRRAVKRLEGAYAIAVCWADEPDRIIAARSGCPLVVGKGIGENFLASDVLALKAVTDRFIFLEEGDLVELRRDSIDIWSIDNEAVLRADVRIEMAKDDLDKGNFRHYMQKEIFAQPQVLQETMEGRIGKQAVLEESFGVGAKDIFDRTEAITIVACGTSYYAASVARYWIEDLVGIPCQVEIASEFRYRKIAVMPNTLFVTITQSGETADTLAALRIAKEAGYFATLTICNVPTSSTVRESDLAVMLQVGTEVGVASTKAFTAQLVNLLLLTLLLGRRRGLAGDQEAKIVAGLRQLPDAIDSVLALDPVIAELAKQFIEKHHALFLGRGSLYPVALEGALKLKEISYIHAEGYAAGELKHGPLALVDDDMPVIAVAPNDDLLEKLRSNLQEVKARGGELFVFADTDSAFEPEAGVTVIHVPKIDPILAPIAYVVPLQLLAYHVAVHKGTDVDQPRNLAKSVTVE